MGGAFVGIGLAQELLDLLPTQPGLTQDAADTVASDNLPEGSQDPLFELLDCPVVARQTVIAWLGLLNDINDLVYLLAVKRGARPPLRR